MINELDIDIGLNTRERLVLAGLIKFPSLPDFELASRMGIKLSTFSTIKKRLKAYKYFTRLYLPNVAFFNMEFITLNIRIISESSLNYKASDKSSAENIEEFFNIVMNLNNNLFSACEYNTIFTLCCYENYISLENISSQLEDCISNLGIKFEFQRELYFPIQLTEFPRFLDYSRLISKRLNLNFDENQWNTLFHHNIDPKMKITQVGQEILYRFLEAPSRTPKEVSQLIAKPRTTTTRWLKKLIVSGVITPRIIPNIKKLGYKLLLCCHIRIISSNPSEIEKALKIIDKSLTPIILMRFGFDVVVVTIYTSFDEVKVAEVHFATLLGGIDIRFELGYRNVLLLSQTTTTLDYMRVFFANQDIFK